MKRMILGAVACLFVAGFAGISSLSWVAAQGSGQPQVEQGSLAGESIELQFLARYETGIFGVSAAEIVSFDPTTKRAFVVNAAQAQVDILDLRDPTQPQRLSTIEVSDVGAGVNSVAVKNGIVAIAVEGFKKTDAGSVVFCDTDGKRKKTVQVGALPDAVTFSPNARYVLVANEGEPSEDYAVDPVGSVSIIDLSVGIDALTQQEVKTAGFETFNGRQAELKAKGVRIYGPGASVAQDVEPEWVEVSSDSRTAYACLQENNALAVIDIESATVKELFSFGIKDWSENGKWAGRGFDASDRDQGIQIRNWPVSALFLPDTIRVLEIEGDTFILGANEGDARDWGDFAEEVRVSELTLDPAVFPDAEILQREENLGRLIVTSTEGYVTSDAIESAEGNSPQRIYRQLFTLGGRSMSIWKVTDAGLELVFDTGSQIEETLAEKIPAYFNADGKPQVRQLDFRSANKGAEPEGLVLGEVNGRTYAFLGLERVGGVMVYDVTVPSETRFVQYINTRDFSIGEDAIADQTHSDLSPEGLCFVPADQSPEARKRPLLLVGHEMSGTTAIYVVDQQTH